MDYYFKVESLWYISKVYIGDLSYNFSWSVLCLEIFEAISRISNPHKTLRWCHNEPVGISNHQPYDCLPNRSFRRRSKKTSKLRVTGLCVGNSSVTSEFPAQMASKASLAFVWGIHQWSVNSPHKWPATRKMFPFDDVIMLSNVYTLYDNVYKTAIHPGNCITFTNLRSIMRWIATWF